MFVNPRHTSQRCAICGHIDERNRTGTVFDCVACGHTDHADTNAATNGLIKAGINVSRPGPGHPRPTA